MEPLEPLPPLAPRPPCGGSHQFMGTNHSSEPLVVLALVVAEGSSGQLADVHTNLTGLQGLQGLEGGQLG